MSTIQVELPAALQPLADGAAVMALDGTSVGDALAALQARHLAVGQRILTRGGALREHVNIFLDEDDVRALAGLETPLAGYRRMTIVPSVAGG
ncbi:putative sulfur carrier protein [Spiribacter salinus M19-40]|jgi:molybdopterin converting factor small subunit|uniref:Putative sulfur carrier protein n=1 Tax=Spiribacter salinus M19-40 TaxID=1260251 RepID=R4V276_9GAMM|nr:MoaD/ThiS family protein [Spiribacter salinus]AGM40149.1 putative sulfur carrier protein [Spiribacter salinus M19-40]MBY5268620.1 hypothetical protein [Spiribacter salinus]